MATAKTKTTVTSVTLTLTKAEAEAVYALCGSVTGGAMVNSYIFGPERAASDAVFYALKDAMDKDVIDTVFYKSLDKSRRSVALLPAMEKWERELLEAAED